MHLAVVLTHQSFFTMQKVKTAQIGGRRQASCVLYRMAGIETRRDNPHGSVLVMAITRVGGCSGDGRRHQRRQEVFAVGAEDGSGVGTTAPHDDPSPCLFRRAPHVDRLALLRLRRTCRPRPPREDGGDSGADIVTCVNGRRDDRAATIDVVVAVIEDVDGRDGAERGDDGARQRTTAGDNRQFGGGHRHAR